MKVSALRVSGVIGLWVMASGAAGCGSSDGGSATPTSNVLVKATPTAPDATCAGGGQRIDVGTDKNENGQLDADEVTGSQTLCNPGVAPTLTTVTPSGATATCRNGGATVRSGVDTNGNGKLDDAEVTSTQEICTGGTSVELATSTAIAPGSPLCPFGGAQTKSGLDDGANGGVAGDGVLEDGEVTRTTSTCTPAQTPYQPSYTPPGGVAGTAQILTGGGAGTGGVGGPAGEIQIGFPNAGTLGGEVAVWNTGKADASFAMPVSPPFFGAVKLDVTADRTIPLYASAANSALGEYYTLQNETGVFFNQDNGAKNKVQVTGVHIAKNVTLTLPNTQFWLPYDLHNEGTITSTVVGGSHVGVNIYCTKLIGAPGSKIALAGVASPGAQGGNGGSLTVLADRIVIEGDIDTSGAPSDGGAVGGAGGGISLAGEVTASSGPIILTGSIKTKGGSSSESGGRGGSLVTQTGWLGVFVKSTIDLSGGAGGGNSPAGKGGTWLASTAGSVKFSGSFTSRGNDADAACTGGCVGGGGGSVSIQAAGGSVAWDGPVDLRGGAGRKNGPGGPGGAFSVATTDGSPDPFTAVPRYAGDTMVSGTIDTRGGAGVTGGLGGAVSILGGTTALTPRGQRVHALGYASVDGTGGAGTAGGGRGADITILNVPSVNNQPSGPVINYAALTNKGGASSNGAGGGSGNVGLVSGDASVASAPGSMAIVSVGAIDQGGGNGLSSGGVLGRQSFSSRERIDIFGAITSTGGGGSSSGGTMIAPSVLDAGTAFVTSAAITLKGGSSTGASSFGGSCKGIQIHGGTVKATATISCAGGNGNGAVGGNGGFIEVSASDYASKLAGLSAPGGTGTPNGAPGLIAVDGSLQ